MRAISVSHKKYRWINDDREMADLILASGYSEVASVSFKKVHDKQYLPEMKLQELKDLIDQHEVNTVIFNEALSVNHLRNLFKQIDLEDIHLLDKAMLILEIFARKANSTDIQLQIKLAEFKYVLPRMQQEVGATLLTDKQARDRGSGESLSNIMKSDVRSRISSMEKQLEELRSDVVLESEVSTIPVLGFYSVGKTTLFNMLTGKHRETDSQAFTTMFLKSSWSKLMGFPLEIVDTVGIIDLPPKVIESFSVMLRRIFSSSHMIICVDASIASELFKEQLEGLNDYYEKFAQNELKYKILFVLTKCDNLDEGMFNEKNRILVDLLTKGSFQCDSYQIMGSRSDRLKYVQETFKSKMELLFDDELFEFELSGLSASELSNVYNIANVQSEIWDGKTVSVKAVIPIKMYNEHLSYLQDKLSPKSLEQWEICTKPDEISLIP